MATIEIQEPDMLWPWWVEPDDWDDLVKLFELKAMEWDSDRQETR